MLDIYALINYISIILYIVIGDRRIIRFIRGCNHNVDETIKAFISFLKWRQDNNVDEIRQDIVYRGMNTPFMFPFGKTIIKLAPQIVIASNSLDYQGRPLGNIIHTYIHTYIHTCIHPYKNT